MISKISSSTIIGIDGYNVDVEIDISQGLPAFDIVGLPDSAVKESKERVRSAIKNSGYSFPIKRITVNLAPGDIRKEGPAFDLPIAIGILQATNIINQISSYDTLITGELSLDGTVKPITGIISTVINAKQKDFKRCIVPYNNKEEASLVKGIDVIGVKTLKDVVQYLNNEIQIEPTLTDIEKIFEEDTLNLLNFEDVKGQHSVKRALEIGAAGNHNILIIGPPGSGKTMLAKRLPSILPSLTFDESLEVTKIYSVSNLLLEKNKLFTQRPFRSPHHTVSNNALTGGGRIPKPGEVSLSHNGILFLDELPEFTKKALEVLRQPLEDRQITVSRVNGSVTYPANIMLVASMNPCPCGYYGSANKCTCTKNEISNYLNRISGPLLDRIDIQIESTLIKYDDLSSGRKSEPSQSIKERVIQARKIQLKRYENENINTNAELTASLIEKYCFLDDNSQYLLKKAYDGLKLSARGYHKILKLARTIADLNNSEHITSMHISEAISCRSLDRKYWS